MENANCSFAEDNHHKPKEHDDQQQITFWEGLSLIEHDGSWCLLSEYQSILSAKDHFKAKNSDIILATNPKSGTTWLKALAFSIVNRGVYTIDNSPLLTQNPHALVPFFEHQLYMDQENPDLSHISDPRMFSTHKPFHILPESIRVSKCKIIYICRNPLDQFISYHHFLMENKFRGDNVVPSGLDESFDMFCQGINPSGPFWAHTLGYWKAHLENPQKVLFLKYEDMKEDVVPNIKKIADFLGCPFSLEGENQGLVEEIARLCSFENLKNLEVNKSGCVHAKSCEVLKFSSFFRKGKVGDWVNYLSPAMAQRMEKVMESKFEGSGLIFKILQQA